MTALVELLLIIVYLVRVDDNLALLFVRARDEQHVVQARSVVEDRVVLERVEHVARPELEQMDAPLVHGHPQCLGPVRGEGLLKHALCQSTVITMRTSFMTLTYRDVEERGLVQGPALDEVEEGLLGLLDVHGDEGLVVHGHVLLLHVDQDPRGQAVCHDLPVVALATRVVP